MPSPRNSLEDGEPLASIATCSLPLRHHCRVRKFKRVTLLSPSLERGQDRHTAKKNKKSGRDFLFPSDPKHWTRQVGETKDRHPAEPLKLKKQFTFLGNSRFGLDSRVSVVRS